MALVVGILVEYTQRAMKDGSTQQDYRLHRSSEVALQMFLIASMGVEL